ncbi:MAG: photosynthetic complex assembly protein PuhC [Hyphomonas sp.]
MTDAPMTNPAHNHDLHPPRHLLMAIGALLLLTLVGVGATQLSGAGHVTNWRALSVESLPLVFEDGADGSIVVTDPATGALLRTWEPETGGFVRTAMRSLALQRRQMGIGSGPAFVLHRTENDKLIMEDPETGEWVSLDAFGGDNVAEFRKLLAPVEAAQ